MKHCAYVAVVLVVMLSGSVQAGLVTVEPDSFAKNTNITNAVSGITLSAVGPGWNSASGSVWTRDPGDWYGAFGASTGSLVFGSDDGSFPEYWMDAGTLQLRVDFATPTDYVAIDVIGDNSHDVGMLRAYDFSNGLLATYYSPVITANVVDQMSITRGSADIAYILAGGDSGASAVGLDNLQYHDTSSSTPVPEPASCALLACAMGGIGVVLKRRRKK